jgi:hypothetical protein
VWFTKVLVAVVCLTACSREPGSQLDEFLAASETVTFDTVTQLGPHRMESVLAWDRGASRGGGSTETLELLWGDWDNFQVRRIRDSRLASEVRVVRGVAYRRSGKGRFRQASDAELYRVQLAGTWSYWERALEPFMGRVEASRGEDAVVEGRSARMYEVRLGPPATQNRARRVHEPASLRGTLILDAALALRLSAELRGRYLESGDPERPVDVRLTVKRSDFGGFPDLKPPSNARRRVLPALP